MGRTASYVEDIPLDIFEREYKSFPRLTLQFRYGKRSDIDGAHELQHSLVAFASSFPHPVLAYTRPSVHWHKSSRLHLIQDRWTDFASRDDVIPLRHFLVAIEKSAMEGTKPPIFHEAVDELEKQCDHHLQA